MNNQEEYQYEFEKWLKEKNISEENEIVPILKEAWNKSLYLACDWFGEMEGIDHDAEKRYRVES